MIALSDFLKTVKYAQSGSSFTNSELHGDEHWRAVAAQGILLSSASNLGKEARASAAIFGVFHDCRRHNDDYDPEHGLRGGQAMIECPHLNSIPLGLITKLSTSCEQHDHGQTTGDPIIGIGWDADRSVLTRVGIEPDFSFFSCTQENFFDVFIEHGYVATRTPPTWNQIWAMAFAA